MWVRKGKPRPEPRFCTDCGAPLAWSDWHETDYDPQTGKATRRWRQLSCTSRGWGHRLHPSLQWESIR